MDKIEERLREQRPELTPVELDRVKLMAMRAARSTPRRKSVKRSRLTVALAVAMIASFSGGAIALNGGLNTHVGNAANTQYGTNGENGQNGANGQPGQNGQNGAGSQTTIVTVNIPPAAPLPGSATPTKAHHKQIRVCKRFAHRSAKFHRTFHPRTCWYRFV